MWGTALEQNAVTCLSVWTQLSRKGDLGTKCSDFLLSVWAKLSSEKQLCAKYSYLFVCLNPAVKWWAAGAPNVVTFCCLSVSNFLGAEHSLLWFCLTWFAILCGLNSIQWFVCLLWPRFQVWNRCGLKQWLLCLVGPSCQMRNSCGTKCNYLFVYLDAAVRWSAGEHPTVTCFSIWAQIK